MEAKSIYLILYHNRYNIHKNLCDHFKITFPTKREREQEDVEFVLDSTDNPHQCETYNFVLILERTRVLADTKENTLQEYWYEEMRDGIRKNHPLLPCSFTFSSKYFTKARFKFDGICQECRTKLKGDVDISINDDNLHFNIFTFDTSQITHVKEIRITGKRRMELKNILIHRKVSNYREEQFATAKDDKKPVDLNKSVTLIKVRQEALDSYIDYDNFRGKSITNEELIKKCGIRKLSLNPFYVFYWTERQIEFWNKVRKFNLPLSFDSTGGVVGNQKFYEGMNNNATFYYVLVVGFEKKIIPLAHAISTCHHTLVINEFFLKWIESGAKTPTEIMTDGSLALRNALNLAFNKLTFKACNLRCFKILIGENLGILELFYRHDIAHILNAARNWVSVKSAERDVGIFYLRSIGYLSQTTILDDFLDAFRSVVH